MDYNGDHKYQCGPFMDGHEEMSDGNQDTSPGFISPGQYKPVQEPGTAQQNKQNKRRNIDCPEFKGFLTVHKFSPGNKEKEIEDLRMVFTGDRSPLDTWVLHEGRLLGLKIRNADPKSCNSENTVYLKLYQALIRMHLSFKNILILLLATLKIFADKQFMTVS